MKQSSMRHSRHRCMRAAWVAFLAGLLPDLVEAPAAAVSVPKCAELSTAANGIQYCDVREGTGKVPSKGSLIR